MLTLFPILDFCVTSKFHNYSVFEITKFCMGKWVVCMQKKSAHGVDQNSVSFHYELSFRPSMWSLIAMSNGCVHIWVFCCLILKWNWACYFVLSISHRLDSFGKRGCQPSKCFPNIRLRANLGGIFLTDDWCVMAIPVWALSYSCRWPWGV